jgi:hypothetical protein
MGGFSRAVTPPKPLKSAESPIHGNPFATRFDGQSSVVGIRNKIPIGSGFSTKLGEEMPVIRPRGKNANHIMRAKLFRKFECFEQGSV